MNRIAGSDTPIARNAGAASNPLTLWDRIVFGSLAAVAGGVLGTAIALLLLFVHQGSVFSTAIVAFSTGFFFIVGYIKGSLAGEFAGEALGITAAAVATMGDAPIDPRTEARTGSEPSLWWWVCYFAGVALLILIEWSPTP